MTQANVKEITVPSFVHRQQYRHILATRSRGFSPNLEEVIGCQGVSRKSQTVALTRESVVQARTEVAATRVARPYIVAKR